MELIEERDRRAGGLNCNLHDAVEKGRKVVIAGPGLSSDNCWDGLPNLFRKRNIAPTIKETSRENSGIWILMGIPLKKAIKSRKECKYK